MRLDYIQPIVDSAVIALAECSGAPVARGTLKLHQISSPHKDVAAIIGMTGEVEGRIILEMDRITALTMAGIMNQEPFADLTPMALDTLMELANIMVARGVSALNDRGFKFRLTPPLIVTGSNISCSSGMNLETLVIPLTGKAGEMNFNVALRMSAL